MFLNSKLIVLCLIINLILKSKCNLFENNKRKPVAVNLYSKWSQTPLYLEALEFLAEENDDYFWKFIDLFNQKLDNLNKSSSDLTPKDQYDYTLEIIQKVLPHSLHDILKFSLSLRNYSPTIEMFNQITTEYLNTKVYTNLCDVFIELSTISNQIENKELICNLEELKKNLDNLISTDSSQIISPNIYKIDHAFKKINSNLIAIIYGDFTSKNFKIIFDYLKNLSFENKLSLYIRHFVKKNQNNTERISLSGYGVELQIKSTEYKAQDDTKVKGEESHLTRKLKTEADKKINEMSGFVINKLKENYPDKKENLDKFLNHLIETSKEISTLKIWELQDLSFQVVQKIKSSPNSQQLLILRDICQNFPLYAKTLSELNVDNEIKKEVQVNQRYFMQSLNVGVGDTVLYINSMHFDLENMDIFTLLQHLKYEIRLLDGLSSVFDNDKALVKKLIYLDLNNEKLNYIINIQDSAVLYINDIENDKIYRNWLSSIQDLLKTPYPGMLRNVRKNLFNLVLIVDPSKKETFDLIKLAESFYVHKAPLRIGFIFSVNPDLSVNGFTDAGVACLNSFNYFYQNKNPYEGLSFLTDLIASKTHLTEISDLTSDEIIKIFKSKFPKVNLDLVFGDDSEYDTGRKLAWEFLNKTAIGKNTQVLLNGVLIKENQLFNDLFEDAILNEMMRQTPTLMKGINRGEITDNTDILDYLMKQKEVVPRLNMKILSNDYSFNLDLSITSDKAKKIVNYENFKLKPNNLVLAFLQDHIMYIFNDENECLAITVWINADFSRQEGIDLLRSSFKYLISSSSNMRIGIIYQNFQENSKIIYSLLKSIKKNKFLISGLNKLSASNSSYETILSTLPTEYVTEFKRNFEQDFSNVASLNEYVTKSILKVDKNSFAVIVNGKVIKSTYNELFIEEDFSLIEKYSMSTYGEKVLKEIEDHRVIFNVHCSDIIMAASNVLISHPNTKTRHRLNFHNPRHSMILIPPKNPNNSVLEIVAIFEPLTRGTQKITSILLTLQNIVNAEIKIFLNCVKKHSEMPLKSFYRYVINEEPNFSDLSKNGWPQNLALFENLPTSPLFTLAMNTPENWLVESVSTSYDLDNIHLDQIDGNGIFSEFELEYLLLEGHCFEQSTSNPPRGLQFILRTNSTNLKESQNISDDNDTTAYNKVQDTIVMANLGYFQLKANPGVWNLKLRKGRSSDIYNIVSYENADIISTNNNVIILISNFLSNFIKIKVSKKPEKINEQLLYDSDEDEINSIWSSFSSWTGNSKKVESSQFDKLSEEQKDSERINIFSLASGHLYERLLRIMMLSVLKNTKTPVKFWFLKNYLSPTFKNILPIMAKEYSFDYELVQYKWPRWLHQQTEKQRIIWGYKILFLDVLFPLDVKKIIFVDADQVVRADLKELRDFDLEGSPYGYTPFCSSREDMDGFRFWKHGYWANHLQGRKYHISALYVVDLVKFRKIAAGDRLRGQYQGLSQDPNSLSNLDQDLPNNMIHQVNIKSLPQEWLWCETWCDDKSKKKAKTIDLCNNPKTKEPKLTAAKRILHEWVGYDEEIRKLVELHLNKPNIESQNKTIQLEDHLDNQTINNSIDHTEL